MEYPKWLKDMDDTNYQYGGEYVPEMLKVIEMAKDAWAMCYLRGTDGGMGIEEFLQKYQDEPTEFDGLVKGRG